MTLPNAETKLIEAIAGQLASGKLQVEEASKLLNTVARFEERISTLKSP